MFDVKKGKSVWVNFKSAVHLAGFKAYNTAGPYFLGHTEPKLSGNLRLWTNNAGRKIRVEVRASVMVVSGVKGAVTGTYWVG